MSNESPIDCGGISYKIQPDARTIEEVRRECRQHILALREKEKELTQLRARVKELEEESKRGMAWADRVEKLRLKTANNLTKSIENNNEQEVTIELLRLTVNQLTTRIRELEEAMRRMIGDHEPGSDCVATGPLTGTAMDYVCVFCAGKKVMRKEGNE